MTAADRRAATVAAVRARHLMAKAALGRRPAVRQRLPVQLPPTSIERQFFAALKQVNGHARQLVEERVQSQLKALARAAADGSNVHDRVVQLVDHARQAFARDYPPTRLAAVIAPFGERISSFQRLQLMRQLKAGLGVEPPLRDAASQARVRAFVTENAEKHRANLSAYFDQVQGKILHRLRPGTRHDAAGDEQDDRGWTGGDDGSSGGDVGTGGPPESYILRGSVSVDELVLDLGKRGEVLDGRAVQLVDLQAPSLFSDLNEGRQAELGILEYTWRTMGDDRVRPEHRALEGKVCRWDRPPSIGNPGDPPGCRCNAEPVLAGMQGEL